MHDLTIHVHIIFGWFPLFTKSNSASTRTNHEYAHDGLVTKDLTTSIYFMYHKNKQNVDRRLIRL